MAQWAYYIGILIVVGTHIYMLVSGLPESQMMAHAWANLAASALLAYSWFSKK